MAAPLVYNNGEDLYEQLEQLTYNNFGQTGHDAIDSSVEASMMSRSSSPSTSNQSEPISVLGVSSWSGDQFTSQLDEVKAQHNHQSTITSNFSLSHYLGQQNFTQVASTIVNDTLTSPILQHQTTAFDLSINNTNSTFNAIITIDKQGAKPTADNTKPPLWLRMAKRMWFITDNIVNYLETSFSETSATSIASMTVLIVAISIISCFIYNLLREEERTIRQEKYYRISRMSSDVTRNGAKNTAKSATTISLPSSSSATTTMSTSVGLCRRSSAMVNPTTTHIGNRNDCRLQIHEMRRETYFGLVRLLKPGCRTILLMCDTDSRAKLLPKFYSCVYPYRRNKTLLFAFLLIEKNIDWYKALLKQALNDYRELHINPKNCIGTVLSLSGFKKYFSVYHTIKQDTGYCRGGGRNGAFDDEIGLVLEDNLLDELPHWLERLFAGKISRYHVKYWPEHMR